MPRTATTSPEHLARHRIVIIGAGPTGLGAAWRLAELRIPDVTIVERASQAGGLATSFRDEAGFTWDVGGHVQFSHYAYFDQVMDQVMAGDWLHHAREAWIWIRDRFVPYPLQYNIQFLPDADARACLLGLQQRPASTEVAPTNFDEWIRAQFGDGLADTFLLPYNLKVWAYPASVLGHTWVGERVATVDLERVVRNMRDKRADVGWGPNSRFRFPLRNGTGEIWRRVAAALPAGTVRYGATVTGVDLGRKRLRTNDAEMPYDILVSTMPLDQLMRVAGEDAAADRANLKYSTVHVAGIGLRGTPPPSLASKCWIYFSEASSPFYRLTVFSNYSPHNVPGPGYWSVMVEVSESPAKPVVREHLRQTVIDGLIATGIITSPDEIVSYWQYTAPYGYPTPFLGRDSVVDPLRERLEQHDVYSRGRFGAWKYEVSNQDHSFMQGVELVDRLAFGRDEVTLCHPEVVNGRPR